MKSSLRLRGLIAAVPTPMDEDGRVVPEAVPPVVERCVADGVSGLFVCGSTGESASLTVAERKAVAAAYCTAADGRTAVIVHVGHCCLEAAAELAVHATGIGADAIAAIAPNYFKPRTADEVVSCLAQVCRDVPETPLYYYNIPAMTGVTVPCPEVLAEAESRLPQLCGVKFTDSNLMDFRLCLEAAGGRYNCLFGRDEMLLGAIAMGAEGAVGTTYSFAAPLYLQMWQAFDRGDIETARRLQARAVAVIELMRRSPHGIAFTKALMTLRGTDVGPCRLPLPRFGKADIGKVRAQLEEIGFFEW